MFEQPNSGNKNDNVERYKERISSFSGEFEIGLLVHIARKSIIWVILLFIAAYISAVAYLRYTQPIFESSSILQVQTNSEARKYLELSDETDRSNLPHVVELLRSKVFFKRVLSKLPLQYSYFSEGTFIASELYTSSPYIVELKNIHQDLSKTKVYVDFLGKTEGVLNYTIDDKSYTKKFNIDKWTATSHFQIKVHAKNYAAIEKQQSIVKSNSFYFTVNNIDALVDAYYPNLNIGILNESAGTVLINFKDLNASKAAAIVSMMSTEYDSFEVEQKGGSSESIIDFIDSQLEIVYGRLKEAENSIRDFKEKYNISDKEDLSIGKSTAVINDLENEIIDIELENDFLNTLEESINSYKTIDNTYSLLALLGGSSQIFPNTNAVGNGNDKIKTQRTNNLKVDDLTKLLLQKEEMLYSIQPESEAMKGINFQINIQLKVLKEQIKSRKNGNQIIKEELKSKLRELGGTLGGGTGSLPENALEYTRLQRSFSINEKYYMLLIEKKTEYSISKAGFVSQNVVLQKGNIPETPISPNKTVAYLVCMFIALLLSFAIIAIRYMSHDQISSINEIARHLSSSIPILGMIPKSLIKIPSSQLLVDKNPKSLIAEAFRSVRSNLQFISNEDGPKVIAITSTISGEGKTFVSINLAGIIAFSGKKVVLIDLDMRKPKIHLGFNVDNNKGMSTLLIGKDVLKDCVQKSNLDNLDFITAGPIPPNPSELVISKKMDELIAHLKTIYDVIVIDNPPVGIVSDGVAMIHKADYPIYVFRADYSKRSFIQNVDRLYNEGSIHKLCIILNGIDIERQSYGYNYGYGYGYGYGSNYGYYDDNYSKEKKSFFKKNK
jgi:capsular exopolysaccharide synthesis family protein